MRHSHVPGEAGVNKPTLPVLEVQCLQLSVVTRDCHRCACTLCYIVALERALSTCKPESAVKQCAKSSLQQPRLSRYHVP